MAISILDPIDITKLPIRPIRLMDRPLGYGPKDTSSILVWDIVSWRKR